MTVKIVFKLLPYVLRLKILRLARIKLRTGIITQLFILIINRFSKLFLKFNTSMHPVFTT